MAVPIRMAETMIVTSVVHFHPERRVPVCDLTRRITESILPDKGRN